MFQTTFPDLQRWLMSPPNFWSAAIVALTRGAGDSRATRPKAVNPFGSNSFAVTFLRDKKSKVSKFTCIINIIDFILYIFNIKTWVKLWKKTNFIPTLAAFPAWSFSEFLQQDWPFLAQQFPSTAGVEFLLYN